MAIGFEQQVVIVTGGGQGLGRDYALELGRRGAAVVVNDLAGLDNSADPAGSAAEQTAAEQTAAAIVAAGGRAVASHDSVATPEGGAAIVQCALDHFGRIDAVIHNAGVWRHKLYAEMTADQLDPVLDVHLRGAFFVTRPAWGRMQAQGYGRIVLTSSSTGAFGREAGSNYAAAKAAMFGLARALHLEGAGLGIHTNCLLPVAPFGRRDAPPAQLTASLAATGLPPDSGPHLVTPMAVWLASRACSVSGEAFTAGGRRFGRVFIGVADGWISPPGTTPTAEDIDAHLAQIEDRTRYAIPGSSWDELSDIGRLVTR
ncbi:MAG: SDR family NAD(P)-dependent oxidoreductase [Sphingomonadales bacterium]|nr:SDR family NAD(P)-dependent oxidoreductase [Sphingomonadales bacterium]